MPNLSKTIAGTSIAILLATGVTGEYFLAKDINLAGEKFTGYEYSQLKPALVARFKERGAKPISYKEAQLWQAAWNRENEKCRFVMTDVTQDNLTTRLNESLEKGC